MFIFSYNKQKKGPQNRREKNPKKLPVADPHAENYSSLPFLCPTDEKRKTKKLKLTK